MGMFLEYHHVDPHVLGGEATIDRVELRCQQQLRGVVGRP
jgi:hypothetical protein